MVIDPRSYCRFPKEGEALIVQALKRAGHIRESSAVWRDEKPSKLLA